MFSKWEEEAILFSDFWFSLAMIFAGSGEGQLWRKFGGVWRE